MAEHRKATEIHLDALGHVEIDVAEEHERLQGRNRAAELCLAQVEVCVAEEHEGEPPPRQPPAPRSLGGAEEDPREAFRPPARTLLAGTGGRSRSIPSSSSIVVAASARSVRSENSSSVKRPAATCSRSARTIAFRSASEARSPAAGADGDRSAGRVSPRGPERGSRRSEPRGRSPSAVARRDRGARRRSSSSSSSSSTLTVA